MRLLKLKHVTALGAAALLLGALAGRAVADSPSPGDWVVTGSPTVLGPLVALGDGTALVGGNLALGTTITFSVQRYFPNIGAWQSAGTLQTFYPFFTLLGDGSVLAAGGSAAGTSVFILAERYDPQTATSVLTGSMNLSRSAYQATLLSSGKVLVSGGNNGSSQSPQLVGPAELYDPGTGTWALTGVLNQFRSGHAAVLLPSGKVLIAGGADLSGVQLASAELYDPATGTWTFTGSMHEVRSAASGVLLQDGRVLVVGRGPRQSLPQVAVTSEVYDPAAETWTPSVQITGLPTSGSGGGICCLVILHNGNPLLVTCVGTGGCASFLFDPLSNVWSSAATPNSKAGVTMAVLEDGRALLLSSGNAAELFRPDNSTPRLVVNPVAADFGKTQPGMTLDATLTTQNTGESPLTGSAVVAGDSFSLVSGGAFTLAPMATTTAVVRFAPQAFGKFTGSVQFMSNGGWISVSFTGEAGVKLSGRVADGQGTGLRGVTVELHGASAATTSTDPNGQYAFIVQPNNSHTVTPTDPRATYSPTTRSVLVGTANVSGLDFVAQAVTGVSLAAAVLPSSRSVQVGSPATAFATIINLSLAGATECGISPVTSVPASFAYQTTDPSTNAVTGSPNTAAQIPGGGIQSYVVAFTPTGPFSTTDVQLSFDCTNSDPAPVSPGLNTLLLSASTTPVPDVVALAATLTNDGIVNIPGPTGAGAFAVATVNVGTSASITASADTGGVSLPVIISLCQTNPGTGQCISAIGPTVTTQINANATPTFGIFVTGTGTVPFDPANNRVFVRFKDAGGVTRGSTSVAVRTQ